LLIVKHSFRRDRSGERCSLLATGKYSAPARSHDARCGGRTWHILHGVNHQSGPVHQPPSSLARDHDPVSPPEDGVYPLLIMVTEVAALPSHGYTLANLA
jgi:hypothetical protein